MLNRVTPLDRSTRLRLLAVVVLVVAVMLCAIFMPTMAMAALGGCVAVVGLMTVARREQSLLSALRPRLVERASTPRSVMGTGPPVPIPLRT